MSDADAVVLVREPELRAHLERLLDALGVPADQAPIVADSLVEADLRGIDSHGSQLMALYATRVRSGDLRPVTTVTTLDDQGSTVRLDSALGFGQVAGTAAMDLAVERALEHGVATVTVRELTHLGALGVLHAARGRTRLRGVRVPERTDDRPALRRHDRRVLDEPVLVRGARRSRTADRLRHRDHCRGGQQDPAREKRGDAAIPAGWANDDRGVPTTDPNAASIHQLQWFGGHKGFGLGMLVEIMSGLLADSCYGTVENTESGLAGRERVAKGCGFVALDVRRFLPLDEFRARVDRLVRDCHESALAPGTERIYVPGEIEAQRRAERLRDGIPLSTALVAELDELAASLERPPLSRQD